MVALAVRVVWLLLLVVVVVVVAALRRLVVSLLLVIWPFVITLPSDDAEAATALLSITRFENGRMISILAADDDGGMRG